MLKFSYRFVLKKGYINDSLKIIFSSKLIISPNKTLIGTRGVRLDNRKVFLCTRF